MQKQRESNERARANLQLHVKLAWNLKFKIIIKLKFNFVLKGEQEHGIKLQSMKSNNIIDFGDEHGEFGSFENNKNENISFQNQNQNQSQIQMENDVNFEQLREREAALNKLEHDIMDVNMIFKDLAVMVHDQGEIIDSIESNVEAVQMRVQNANSHLESAKKNQVKKNYTFKLDKCYIFPYFEF